MPHMKRCCCWNSVRKGSFASGIFTLTFYTIIFTTCAFHVSKLVNDPWMFRLSFAMLILSGMVVVTSIIMIVGLCGDNKQMMIPWMVSLFCTTILDLILFFYLIFDMEGGTQMFIFAVMDCTVVSINVTAILCVLSQYHEYSVGRGMAEDSKRSSRKHRLEAHLSGDCVALKITENTSTISSKSTNGHYLALPSPTRTTIVN